MAPTRSKVEVVLATHRNYQVLNSNGHPFVGGFQTRSIAVEWALQQGYVVKVDIPVTVTSLEEWREIENRRETDLST